MRIKDIAILAAASLSASAVAADQPPPSAIPVPASCTVSPDATGTRAIVPIADFGIIGSYIDVDDEIDAWLPVVGKDGSGTVWNARSAVHHVLYPPGSGGAPTFIDETLDRKLQLWENPVGYVQLWDVRIGQKIADFGFGASSRAISRDSNHVAVLTGNATVALFDRQSGKVIERQLTEKIANIAFSEDGTRLFATTQDNLRGELAELDAVTGETILNYLNDDPSTEMDWRINRDGLRLLETYSTGILIDAKTGKILNRSALGRAWHARFSVDGKFVVATEEHRTRIIDTKDGRVIREFSDLPADVPYYLLDFDVQFAPDGRSAVVRDKDGHASLIRIPDGRTLVSLGRFATAAELTRDFSESPSGHTAIPVPYPTGEFAFSLDGSRLITSDSANVASLWDVRSGKRLRVFGEGGYVQSPNGAWLVTITEQGSADLWATRDGRHVATLGKQFHLDFLSVSFVNSENRESGSLNGYGEYLQYGPNPPPYVRPRPGAQSPEERLIISDGATSALWSTRTGILLAKLEKTSESSINVTWKIFGDHIYALKQATLFKDELWDISENRRIAKLSGLGGVTDIVQEHGRIWFLHNVDSVGLPGWSIAGGTSTFELGDARTGRQLLACDVRLNGNDFVSRQGALRAVTIDKTGHATLWRVGPQ